MQPGLQPVKSDTPVQLDDQFAVDDKLLEWEVQQRRHNLRERAAQRRPGFSPQVDRAVILESQAVKAVPFRLELPLPRFIRKRLRGSRLHRRRAVRVSQRTRRRASFERSSTNLRSEPAAYVAQRA